VPTDETALADTRRCAARGKPNMICSLADTADNLERFSWHSGRVAGYSPTPQARKLGLKAGQRVALVRPPSGWQLDDPPEVSFVRTGDADVIIAFVRTAAELDSVPELGQRIFPDGALWVAWPRRAAGHVSDVTENGIRDVVLPVGLVDVKVAAIDEDWSGLKIVWRREKRSG
jgi:hypothetical protein